MIHQVSPTTLVPERPTTERKEIPAGMEPKPAAQAATATAPSGEANRNIRMVIELDQNRGIYVYRLIDRETGNVITSIPRSEVGKLAESPNYQAGGVVSTTA